MNELSGARQPGTTMRAAEPQPRQIAHPWVSPLAKRLLLPIGCALLCVGLLLAVGWWPLPPWSASVNVGAEGGFREPGRTATVTNFFGIHESEQSQDGSGRTFRWTSAEQATLTFPAAQRMQPLLLSMIACGCRDPNTSTPLTLALNQQPVFQSEVGDQWRRYEVLVPPDLPHPDYSLMAAIQAPTWTSAEGRTVGIALDDITLHRVASVPPVGWESTVLVLAALVGLAWWRRGLLLPLLLAGSWLLLLAVYQPQLLPAWLLAAALVAGLVGLWGLAAAVPAAPVVPMGLALWLVLSPQLLGHWVLDDAYISFRYARHFAEGHGLVYNIGERVEGYTNFLWTVLLAGVLRVGGDPVLVSAALTLLLGFGLLALTVWLAHRLMPPLWAWSAGVLVALSSPFLLYTSRGSGMETALFALLVLAILTALLRQRWLLAGGLTALTLLTRPDGIVVAAVGGGYALWMALRGASAPGRWWPLLRYSLPVLLIYGPYFVWRYSYYGYLLPNTFYVKVGTTRAQLVRGLEYVWQFGRDDLLLMAAAVALAAGLWGWRSAPERARWPHVGLLVGFGLLWCAYVVAVGGDWMPGARFLVVLVPVLAILIAWGLAGLAQRSRGLHLLALAGLLVLAGGLVLRLPETSTYNPESLVRREQYVVERYREAGRWINAHTPPDTLLAAASVGALPYYAQRPTIDILGLNDEHIAHLPDARLGEGKPGHEKTDPAYVLGREPQIIPRFAVPYLNEHPLFRQHYRRLRVAGPEGTTVLLYVRHDMPSLIEDQ